MKTQSAPSIKNMILQKRIKELKAEIGEWEKILKDLPKYGVEGERKNIEFVYKDAVKKYNDLTTKGFSR